MCYESELEKSYNFGMASIGFRVFLLFPTCYFQMSHQLGAKVHKLRDNSNLILLGSTDHYITSARHRVCLQGWSLLMKSSRLRLLSYSSPPLRGARCLAFLSNLQSATKGRLRTIAVSNSLKMDSFSKTASALRQSCALLRPSPAHRPAQSTTQSQSE